MRIGILTLLVIFFTTYIGYSQVIWFEDFSGETDGVTSGTATGGTWSVNPAYGGTGTFSKQSFTFFVTLDYFEGSDLNTEAVWETNVIDISATGYATIDLLGTTIGTEAGDYLQAYYKVDGGPEVLFYDMGTSGISLTTGGSAIVNGSTLQVVVRMRNDPGDFYSFDDVTVTRITTLYSRANGNWNASGTWSIVALGGANCTCTPNDNTRQVIGNNNTVTLTAAANTTDLEIRNTGTLRWNGNFDLDFIKRGYLTIDAGGTLTNNGNAGAQIDYDESFTHAVTNNGSFTIGDLQINGNTTLDVSGSSNIAIVDDLIIDGDATLNLGGTGSVTIGDDIDVNTNDLTFTGTKTVTASDLVIAGGFGAGTVTNSLSSSLTVGSIQFSGDNSNVVNNGTFTNTGNITVGASGDDNNVITNNAGATLSFVSVSANDGDFSIINSGTINQSGTFGNIPNNTNGGNDINNLNGAIWNYSGTGHDRDVRLFANNGTNTFNYNLAGNQDIITPVTGNGYSNIGLQNSGVKRALTNFNIYGNWVVSGSATFREETYNVTFSGSGSQTITNSSGEVFYGLTVNKPAGSLNLSTSPSTTVTVTSALTLTNGIVNTASSQLLIINQGATASSGNASSYVDGPIRKIGNNPDPFIFPTGDGSIWARIGVDYISGSSASTQFTAQYFDAPYPDLTNDGSFNNVSGLEYWTLDQAVTTATARVQLYWENGTRSEINSVTADLVVAKYTSPDWGSVGQSAITGNTTAGTVTSNNVTTFSPFSFGSLSSGLNPLPVELLSFSAQVSNDVIDLNWATASELNNNFFTIERSIDVETFEEVATVEGNGTTNKRNDYHTEDKNPIIGRSYYRLKQTDFDGTSTYSDMVTIEYEGPAFASLHAYPNPSNGDVLTLQLKGVKEVMDVPVRIVSMQGKLIFEGIMHVDETGKSTSEIEFKEPLTSGLYIIKAGPSVFLTQKVAVIR